MFKKKIIFILIWVFLVSCATDPTNPNGSGSIGPRIVYDKPSLNVVYGTAASASVTDVVLEQGQGVLSYELTNSSSIPSEITFDATNGAISISDSLDVGNYELEILTRITNSQMTNRLEYSYSIAVTPRSITNLGGDAFSITDSTLVNTIGLVTDITGTSLNGESLTLGEDYDLRVTNVAENIANKFSFTSSELTITDDDVPTGTYTIALLGKGNFSGETTTDFEITGIEQALTAFEYVRYQTNRAGTTATTQHFYVDYVSVNFVKVGHLNITEDDLSTTATRINSAIRLLENRDDRSFQIPNTIDPQDFRVRLSTSPSTAIRVSDLANFDLIISLTKSSTSGADGSLRLKGGYFRFYFTDPSLNVSTSGVNVADLSASNSTIVATLTGGRFINLSQQ